MPIRTENRERYPKDWPRIRERIRMRARNACEKCGIPNGITTWRGVIDGRPVFTKPGNAEYFDADSGEIAHVARDYSHDDTIGRHVRIVCTVAHLRDQDPAACEDSNLGFLCQRCHNLLDMPMRQAHARETRRARKAVGDLFGGAP